MSTTTFRGASALALVLTATTMLGGSAPLCAADDVPAVASIAGAVEANPALRAMMKDYDAPLFIPAADFRTDGLYPEAQSFSVGGYWRGDDLGGVYMVAPVWLPDGAEIASIWLFAIDDDDDCANEDVTMWLQRVDNFDGTVDGMAVMSTTGSSPNMQTPYESDPTHPVIDYPAYSYWLTVRVCSTDHELYGAMIFY